MHQKIIFVIFFNFAIHICLSLFAYLPFTFSSTLFLDAHSSCSSFQKFFLSFHLTLLSDQSRTHSLHVLKQQRFCSWKKLRSKNKTNKTKPHKLICNYFSFTKQAIWDVYTAERGRFFKGKFKIFVYYFKTKEELLALLYPCKIIL